MIDYLAIGHVTRDLLPDGAAIPGGSVLYAAATAQRLGLRTGIVTTAAQPDVPELPVEVHCASANITTTFENRYLDGERTQFLHACAPPVTLDALPPDWYTAPMVHLAPVVHECDLALAAAFPQALVFATPQGWLREWDHRLPSAVRRRVWLPAPALLQRLNGLVLSIEDVAGDEHLPKAYAQHCPLVVVTRGAAGVTVYAAGHVTHLPAVPANERDPTGAGDVFAAALLIRLRESADLMEAARFAAATAACAVETLGMAGIPDRETVWKRLEN